MRTTKAIMVGFIILLLCFCVPLLSTFIAAPSSQATSPDEVVTELSPIERPEKGHPKLESSLNQLVAAEQRGETVSFAPKSAIELVNNEVRVIIEATPGEASAAQEAATALGATVETTYRGLVQVVIPISRLTALADAPSIRLVRLPWQSVPAVVSEGASLIDADDWNSAGFNGTGVKVAILDLGFQGYDALLGTELPSSVTVQSFRSDGNITGGGEVHGTACAEIVYDIAPDADFYLVNFGTEVEMGNAVDWLIAQGVDVISYSIGWVNTGPGDGTGPICDMVDQARVAGILWSNSAGNQAQSHWMGDWDDTYPNGWHDFDPGVDESNAIWANDGDWIAAFLKWDDIWGASGNDYDLYLADAGWNIVWGSVNVQDGDDDPTEGFWYQATDTGYYHIAINRYDADGTAEFHLHTFNQDLQYQVASSSLMEPADSTSAVTVGAVFWNDPSNIEPFSSQGPTEDARTKPDLMAPDGVSTSTYGASDGVDWPSGGTGFFGTSASAPHAAGAAVLVKERFPSYTPDQIQAFLEGRAIDLGDAGKDNVYGSGRLALSVPNQAPTAPVVDVTPDLPATDDDLTCTVTSQSSDPDGDTVTYTYEWFKDDVLQANETTITTALSDTVSSVLTAKDEVWKCVVTPNDGFVDGPSDEDQVKVGNSPPTALVVDVTPDLPATTDDLTCTVTSQSSDPDGDTMTYTYQWFKNDVLQPDETTTTTALNDTLSSALTAKGEIWKCVVTPKDGFVDGPSDEDQTTIQNSPPSVANVTIAPDPAYTNTDLTAVPSGWSDPDGDTEDYQYQWQKWSASWVDIPGANSSTLDSSNFVKDDQIKLICTPYDGEANGTPVEDTITISNALPTAPVVDVTPDLPTTDDDLTCTVTAESTDPDGDTVTYTYQWFKNDVLQANETTTTTALNDTLSSALTAKWEIWKCVVTPNDGFVDGPSDEDQVLVGNTPPTAPVVDVTPDLPVTTDDLTCNITTPSTDPDGDTVTYTYQWYKNDVLQANETTTTTALNDTLSSALTAKGEVWKCVVTPNDGFVDGPSDEDQTTIQNSPPSVANVTIAPDPAYTNTDLTAVPSGWSDPDGDTEDYQYQWQKWSASWVDIPGANSSTLDSSNFVKDDQIKLICTPYDGFITGSPEEDTITISNAPPVADAGPDQMALINTLITLDGSASSDADGDLLTYLWTQTDGPIITLSDPTAVNPTFTPTQAGTYAFSLVVNDGIADSSPDTVDITVKLSNVAPTLSDGVVSLTSGDAATNFTYTVTYTDADDDAPMSITVTINGGAPQDMTVLAGQDGVYTNGEVYEFSITGAGLGVGSHTFQFAASDGIDDATGDTGSHDGPTVSAPPTGGGGGGGGAPPPGPELEVDMMGTVASESITEEGVVEETIQVTSVDGVVTLRLLEGTVALDSEGNCLEEITVDAVLEPPSLLENWYVIGMAYDFGPDGATFGSSLELTIRYDPEALPEGVSEEDLAIGYYDSESGEWVLLPSVVDTEAQTVTASISHFTSFAIIGRTIPDFVFSNLSISPALVDPGESVTISVQVTNSGGLEGSYIVSVLVGEEEETTEERTLASGASDTVAFAVTRQAPGTYSVEIDGLTGEFTVTAPPFPWPLVGGIIGALLLAGIVALFAIRLRRRKALASGMITPR